MTLYFSGLSHWFGFNFLLLDIIFLDTLFWTLIFMLHPSWVGRNIIGGLSRIFVYVFIFYLFFLASVSELFCGIFYVGCDLKMFVGWFSHVNHILFGKKNVANPSLSVVCSYHQDELFKRTEHYAAALSNTIIKKDLKTFAMAKLTELRLPAVPEKAVVSRTL